MYKTIDDIKAAHVARGGHFFDKDTMRFFKSRVLSHVYPTGGAAFFITSERDEGQVWSHAEKMYRYYDSGRKYTVRHIDPDGNVTTFGDFMQHATIRDAQKMIEEVLRGYRYADTGQL